MGPETWVRTPVATTWKVGRADECTGFENQRTEKYRGFESLTFRMATVQQEIEACKKKKRYGTEQAAQKAAQGRMANPNIPDLRVYKCPRPGCGGYHLTKHHGRDDFD
jgi:hypothetical protein